jgi:hypothetical protein
MENVANSPQGMGNANRRDQDASAKVPGHVYNRLNEYRAPLATRVNERQIHNKTVRTLCIKNNGLSFIGFESLAILDTYLSLFSKTRQHRDKVIDWSGAGSAWKLKVRDGIEAAIRDETIKQTGGTLEITEKGSRLLEDYNIIFEDVKELYISKAAAKLNRLIINKL